MPTKRFTTRHLLYAPLVIVPLLLGVDVRIAAAHQEIGARDSEGVGITVVPELPPDGDGKSMRHNPEPTAWWQWTGHTPFRHSPLQTLLTISADSSRESRPPASNRHPFPGPCCRTLPLSPADTTSSLI